VRIRSQLLIVGLSTLALPWAGCQYARELETALRGSQEQALRASAVTVADALSAEPQRVFRDASDRAPFDPARGDIYVFPLSRQPLLDGYRDDWPVPQEPVELPDDGGPKTRLQAGATERYLFLYAEVEDRRFVSEPGDVHASSAPFDRVELLVQRADGALGSYFFATDAPGLIEGQSLALGDDGSVQVGLEPRLQAYGLQTKEGYHLEIRIPLSMVGSRLWIRPRDGLKSQPEWELPAIEHLQGGRLLFASEGLDELLASFVRDGTRATVVDSNGLKFGTAGAFESSADAAHARALSHDWFRALLDVDDSGLPLRAPSPEHLEGPEVHAALGGQVATAWLRGGRDQSPLLSVAAPIVVDGVTRGALVLEQSGDQLLGLRDHALTRLFYLTSLATAITVAFLFGFASWIGVRIGRLQAAADAAIGPDGRISLRMPEASRADELGSLARSFEGLLARLNEHTQYLRTLGGKLAHELRTPLTIVRSSLDNLESEGLREDQRAFVQRARDGSQRLASILSALGAAARVEESIKHSERVNVDLRHLLIAAVGGYQSAFPQIRIEPQVPRDACFLHGAPDLIVQMLDKLVDNAVDFCPAGGAILIELVRDSGDYRLSVGNDGPPIPAALLPRLFESLFEHRSSPGDKPHFGLGLYIVRLIAEFHGGRALAGNRADGGGALFTVILPSI
jgi:dedicated sortase system histidine kinase